MRIRFTLDIERRRPDAPPIEMERDVEMGSLVERVGQQPIGFTANPGRTPEPGSWEDRR